MRYIILTLLLTSCAPAADIDRSKFDFTADRKQQHDWKSFDDSAEKLNKTLDAQALSSMCDRAPQGEGDVEIVYTRDKNGDCKGALK